MALEVILLREDGEMGLAHGNEVATTVFSSDDGKWHLGCFIVSKRPRLVVTDGEAVAVFQKGSASLSNVAATNAGAFAITTRDQGAVALHVLFSDGRQAEIDGIDFDRFSFGWFPENNLTLEIVNKDDSRERIDLSGVGR